MIAKLPNEIDGDESVVLMLLWNKLDDLIDLVLSQQEAIEKLERVFETQTVSDIMLPATKKPYKIIEMNPSELSQLLDTEPADDKPDKATITTVGIVENGKAIGWGFKWEENTIHPNYNSDGKELIGGYTIEELKKIADDKPVSCRKCMTNTHIELCCPKSYTHRTVTLRIPKGMRIGEAIMTAWEENDTEWHYLDQWLDATEDTDLQKALDEVKK